MAFCFGFAGRKTAHGHNIWENNALELANQSVGCFGYKHKPFNNII